MFTQRNRREKVISMVENYESVLRKSLDSVDRRQKWMKITAVVFIALGGGNMALAMIYLQDLKMLYIATFIGMILWTGGLAVAILGVSKQAHKPVYQNGSFVPRLILPLSLSYDHRVIDGALAARFITFFAEVLADMRRALL